MRGDNYLATKGFIKFNGKQLPNPKYLTEIQRQQLVKSARNSNGVVVASKINRRQIKLILTFPHLTSVEWAEVLDMIEGFYGNVSFYDPKYKKIVTRKMYWGDSSEKIFKLDSTNTLVTEYIDCTCNLIDCGGEVK